MNKVIRNTFMFMLTVLVGMSNLNSMIWHGDSSDESSDEQFFSMPTYKKPSIPLPVKLYTEYGTFLAMDKHDYIEITTAITKQREKDALALIDKEIKKGQKKLDKVMKKEEEKKSAAKSKNDYYKSKKALNDRQCKLLDATLNPPQLNRVEKFAKQTEEKGISTASALAVGVASSIASGIFGWVKDKVVPSRPVNIAPPTLVSAPILED